MAWVEAKIDVKGLEEVRRRLLELPDDVRNRVARKTIRAAIEPMAKRARELVPVFTGRLRDTIKTKYNTFGKGELIVGRVLAGEYERAHQAWLIEYGHRMVATKRQGGGPGSGKLVGSGHVRAYPFMRPAFDQYGSKFADMMHAALNAELARLERKR